MGLGNKPWVKIGLILLVIIIFVLFRKFNKKTVEGFGITTTMTRFSVTGANNLRGMCFDSTGNMYMCDMHNNRILIIDTNGSVSTFAGSASPGFVNGTGTNARFYYPAYIVIDSSNNLYVTDFINNVIRKITTPGAVVTTFAGSGIEQNLDGTGTAARFAIPYGLTIDSSNNLYVSEYRNLNNSIRKITPGGVVTSIAYRSNTGSVTYQINNDTSSLCVDSSNNIFLAGSYFIIKINSTGFSLFAGGTVGFLNGTGSAARFQGILSMTIDSSNNLYVGESGNRRIRMITPSGVVTTYAGNGTAGNSVTGPLTSTASINQPYGLLWKNNKLYIADTASRYLIESVTTCPVGQYVNGTNCSQCPINTYNATADTLATSCTPCTLPANASQSTTSGTGSTSSGSCIASSCMPGYTLTNGNCIACTTGSYSTGGANTICTACTKPTGTETMTTPSAATSQAACTATSCQGGYGMNNGQCIKCLAGTRGLSGGGGCTTCSLGTYSSTDGSQICTACPYPTGTSSATTSSTGSTSSATCRATKCIPG
jgi:hypothetical protein